MRTDWNERLEKARGLKPLDLSVLCAFNSNVDVVKRLDRSSYQSLPLSFSKSELARVRSLSSKDYFPLGSIETRAEAFAALKWSVERGEAVLVSTPPHLIKWLESAVSSQGVSRLGGQASLMAENLLRLGCKTVLYPRTLSKRQAGEYSKGMLYPVAGLSGVKTIPIKGCANSRFTKENLVLEYGRDLSCRPNRVIYSSKPEKKIGTRFNREWTMDKLRDLGGMLDACLFSGFHHSHSARELRGLFKQLDALKQGRGRFEFHCEYAPFEDKRVEVRVLRELCKRIDSLGLNEIELRELHKALFNKGFNVGNVRSLVRAAERVFKALTLHRLHVHDLGLHIVVLDGKRDPERCVQACLLASDESSFKASGGKARPCITQYSLGKMRSYSRDAEFLRNGFVKKKGYYVIVAPATFVDKPVRTVGLGDIVSSTAFAAELAHA